METASRSEKLQEATESIEIAIAAKTEDPSMKQQELIPHLFRTEFSKISSVLSRSFGVEYIGVAEDITSEVFLLALETWTYNGIPQNPTAWLYAVAKNKARNYIRRHKLFSEKISNEIKGSSPVAEQLEIDLSDGNIKDSQLMMLFAVCHPSISAEGQISLALRLLCGFGIAEIADAFLTNKETINKRLFRAKERLREEKIAIEFPPGNEIHDRLDNVLTTLYLFFNEGYYSEREEVVVRKDLCLEAMRLTHLLTENNATDLPRVRALLALMCFHASRFEARTGEKGEMILYDDQDELRWNRDLIAKGIFFLREASTGNSLSQYHLEASIAYWHTVKADTSEKWESILSLYDKLLVIAYSPIAALNRIFALSKTKGKAEALKEAGKLHLINNHFYFALLGELYTDIDNGKARENFERALKLAKTNRDKMSIREKLLTC